MGVVIGRQGAWRRYVGLLAAMAAAVIALLAAGKGVKQREEEPRVRVVDADPSAYAGALRMARVASLWVEGRGYECFAPAVYDGASARFSPAIVYGAPLRAPVAGAQSPVGALWARLAGAYEAPAPVRAVSFEIGEPAMVSIRRSASFSQFAVAA